MNGNNRFNMKKSLFTLLLLLQAFSFCNAQNTVFVGEDLRDVLFRQSVKSCDEFMCRFNEEEFFPDLDKSDPLLYKKNFLFLFDYTMSQGKDKTEFLNDIYAFYDSVKVSNTKLQFESQYWYSELRANFAYKKKTVELGLVFKTEITPKGLPCWTLTGINGLEKIGYVNSDVHFVISPEQHESEFMEIDSDFKINAKEFSKFRSYGKEVNSLSYFFALVESGILSYVDRLYCIFHFFDVPSYYFKVKYCSRKKANNGWLITDYKKVNEEDVTQIKKNLLGL